MTKVYIVEKSTWDYVENVKLFFNKEKAVAFCDLTYEKTDKDYWIQSNFFFVVEEYEVE